MLGLIIGGGFDTTTALTAHALEWLSENPDERSPVELGPRALLNPATEEFLRYFTPAPGDARTFSAELRVRRHQLKEGERLWLSWAMANRDPSVFADPTKSSGPQGQSALQLRTRRTPLHRLERRAHSVQVDADRRARPDAGLPVRPGGAVHYETIGVIQGMRNLPATFHPGASASALVSTRPCEAADRSATSRDLARPITEMKESLRGFPTRQSSTRHRQGGRHVATTTRSQWSPEQAAVPGRGSPMHWEATAARSMSPVAPRIPANRARRAPSTKPLRG